MSAETKPQPPLVADVAIDDPSQDRLERLPFAKSLARSIIGLQGDDSFVFGLCGPWGSGKTSVLNLVLKELAAATQQPIVVRFNPWWFSGRRQLLESFLNQFAATLAIPELGKSAGKAATLFQRLSTGLRPLSFLPVIGEAAKAGSEITKGIGEAAKMYADAMKTDVFRAKAEINEALASLDRRIIVVMDDIDRLSADEIAELFLILKAVADFPKTVYLLAFDGRVVRRAIRNRLGVNGKTYLEKIVQLQIDLPSVGYSAVQQLFIEQIDELLKGAEISESFKQDLGNLFHDGVKHFLTTPRASKKILNILRFSYPPLKGEVYFPDLLGVATLFTFSPAAVQAIANNAELFTGTDRLSEDRNELKAFHEAWLGKTDTQARPHVERIVKRLFPKFAWALGGPAYSAEFASSWARGLRACSSTHFEKYFLLAVPSGALSEAEWSGLIKLLDKPERFEERLIETTTEKGRHFGLSKGKEVLDRLADFVGQPQGSPHIEQVFKSILKLGDPLIQVKDEERLGGMLPWDNERRVLRVLVQSLVHLKENDRVPLLLDGVERASGLLTVTELVYQLGREHGMFVVGKNDENEEEPILSADDMRRVLRHVKGRIRKAAEGDETSTIAQHPSSLKILRNWCLFGPKSAATKWIRRQAQRDDFLLGLLRQASSKIRSHGMSDRVVREDLTMDTSYLGYFLDLKRLKKRCSELLNGSRRQLSDEERKVVRITHDLITDEGNPVNARDRSRAMAMNQHAAADSSKNAGPKGPTVPGTDGAEEASAESQT